MRCPHCESPAPESTLVEVLDPRAQILQRLLLHDLVRSPQRHHVQPQAAPLEVEQLVEDERLGKARKTVDQNGEIYRAAMSSRPICGLQRRPQHDGSAARWLLTSVQLPDPEVACHQSEPLEASSLALKPDRLGERPR